jgi:hypothetical protein
MIDRCEDQKEKTNESIDVHQCLAKKSLFDFTSDLKFCIAMKNFSIYSSVRGEKEVKGKGFTDRSTRCKSERRPCFVVFSIYLMNPIVDEQRFLFFEKTAKQEDEKSDLPSVLYLFFDRNTLFHSHHREQTKHLKMTRRNLNQSNQF